ncbi:MAG TPA: RNA-binding protein [Rhodospirillales bacterium]|nr:RNA-binding protein [Rhodospirillales bacterium]
MVTKQRPDKAIPQRRCIASHQVRDCSQMIRFVLDPENRIVADIAGKLPGRGFWLSAERDMLNTACAKNLFARAARTNVTVAGDLVDRVERQLVKRCQEHLGLARRAGMAVAGFEKVETWLKTGKGAGVLLAAVDGSAQGRAKIAALGRALAKNSTLLECLDSAELAAPFGRDKAVHAVVAKGRLAEKLSVDGGRLQGLRRQDDVAGI